MTLDDHDRLRGHIPQDAFASSLRQAWRSHRYQEALAAHHAYSTDRPALLRVMTDLLTAYVREANAIPESQLLRILDVGTGTGEVSSRLLGALAPLAAIDYCGLDKNRAVLEAGLDRLRAAAGTEAGIALQARDFSAPDWADGLGEGRFHMVWLVHSGYYVEAGHADFLATLAQLAGPDGLLVFIHNPEGNAPFRSAAGHLGLPWRAVPYERRIEPPAVPDEVFDVLAGEPGDLDSYSRRFAGLPEARSLRLMLEFYLPEYPLEGLPEPDRTTYVGHWRRHLATSGRFANQHEMLVVSPRRPGADTWAWLESYLGRTHSS